MYVQMESKDCWALGRRMSCSCIGILLKEGSRVNTDIGNSKVKHRTMEIDGH